MYIERLCKICGIRIKAYTSLQNKCKDCTLKNTKPLKQQGRQARLYQTFRDKVAIPYLDNKYGHVCSVKDCNETKVDVDHIKKRGSHPDLKFDVKNLRYLCREHHQQIT